jgi:hypothetical protein
MLQPYRDAVISLTHRRAHIPKSAAAIMLSRPVYDGDTMAASALNDHLPVHVWMDPTKVVISPRLIELVGEAIVGIQRA